MKFIEHNILLGCELATNKATSFQEFRDTLKDSNPRIWDKLLERTAKLKNGSDTQFLLMNTSLKQLFSTLLFIRSGSNVFNLTAGLTAALLLTTVEEIPNLPFDSFFMRIPAGIIPGTTIARVSQYTGTTGVKMVFIDSGTDDPSEPGTMLSVPLGEFFEDLFPVSTFSAALALVPESEALAGHGGKPMIRLVAGLCSFLASKIEPLEPDNARAISRAEWTKKPIPRAFTVGRSVKVSRELRDLAASGIGGATWILQNRYCVRGHFRWQPVGRELAPGVEGPVNRKKIWIQPHWKGPEGAEAWRHVYEVAAPAP